MQDKERKIREQLWEKASKEFEIFKAEQLKESKESIFDSAYKITMLNDFTEMCDPNCSCLSLDSVKALLREQSPVHTLYNFYQGTDEGSINDLYESIWYQLSELVEENNTKQNLKKHNKDAR